MRVKRVCTTMMHFTSCLLFNIILIIYIFSYEWFYVRFYAQKCKLKMFTLNNGYLFLFRSRDNDVRLKFFCVIKRAVYSMFYLVLQSFSSSLAPWRHNSVHVCVVIRTDGHAQTFVGLSCMQFSLYDSPRQCTQSAVSNAQMENDGLLAVL